MRFAHQGRALAIATLLLSLAACSEDAAPATNASTSASATTSGTGGSNVGSTSASGGMGGSGGGTGGGAEPQLPTGLVTYWAGDPADKVVTPAGPALVLMGGGTDVDAAFQQWIPLIAGGDVVVLRTSGADGYNDYLYATIGGADSVETMLPTTPSLANSDYVATHLARAEAIFMAGGDQATYVAAWKGTRVEEELEAAYNRGAVIGGTSAGCAILGDFAFSALNDTVYSDEALADPYNQYMTMEQDFLDFPPLSKVITDTHFGERDRMGRLVTFVARVVADGWAVDALGIGVDEATALWVDKNGQGTVFGSGSVYLVRSAGSPTQCTAGAALEYNGLGLLRLTAGDQVMLPSGESDVVATSLSASGGVTVPADPY